MDSPRSLNAGAVICDSLSFIMNWSIPTWSFINDWKVAKIMPMYKSGNTSEVSNYWSTSILSVPSKILEQHVHATCYDYLESNNLITIYQSGFRPKHSCDTVLIKMTNQWLFNIKGENMTGCWQCQSPYYDSETLCLWHSRG